MNEQIDRTEDGKFLAVRDGKKLTSTTLNNPVEPESTIRTKTGETHQGYVGNFAETVDLETNRKIRFNCMYFHYVQFSNEWSSFYFVHNILQILEGYKKDAPLLAHFKRQ